LRTMSSLSCCTIAILALVPDGATAKSHPSGDTSRLIPVEDLEFYRNAQGFTVANAWGDPAHGAHSNYIRMAGQSASGLHTHSASYYGVVISGVVANEPDAAAPEHALAAGSYWYQKGREPHVTKCISKDDCLFFVTSKGSFDYLDAGSPAAEPAQNPRR
jgi:hypothetical protein